jgi:thioredoxin-like negative regulator of GroEL
MVPMRFRQAITAAAILSAIFAVSASQPNLAQQGTFVRVLWLNDKVQAFALSSQHRRPIIVDVWADWCAPCKVMEATTFRHPDFRLRAAGFIPLKINADADVKFADRYQANILPTTLFLDHEGRLLGKISGMIESTDLCAIMDRILAGYPDYLQDLEHTDQPVTQMAISGYLLRIGNSSGSVSVLQQTMVTIRETKPLNQEQYEIVELRLAGSLVQDGKASEAVKILQRLASTSASKVVQGRALFGLVKTERNRGELLKAERALRRLKREYPELAIQLN